MYIMFYLPSILTVVLEEHLSTEQNAVLKDQAKKKPPPKPLGIQHTTYLDI